MSIYVKSQNMADSKVGEKKK